MALTTLSKFKRGSPIPIITILVIFFSFAFLGVPKEFSAIKTCPIISLKVKFLENPCLPVAQKLQFTTQPTWDETHKVFLPFSGINTISIDSLSPTSRIHFFVPSFETSSKEIFGTFITQFSIKYFLNDFEKLDISLKFSTPF